MSGKTVLVEKKERICTLTLNRPKTLNALNQDMISELESVLFQLIRDTEIRVVVLQGAEDNFCSGADMSLFMSDLPAPEWMDGMKTLGRIIGIIRSMPQPIVVKLKGAAIGGGANLALAGDFVIAAHNAKFCENFVNIGLVLDAGGTYFLPRLVGLVKARELALLGDRISGKDAAAMGLIYKSVPEAEIDREVDMLARILSQKSLRAMAFIKEGLESSFDMNLKELVDREAGYQSVLLQAEEHKAPVRAFLAAKGRK